MSKSNKIASCIKPYPELVMDGDKIFRRACSKLLNTMSVVNMTPIRNSLHYPLSLDGDNMEKELSKPFKYITSVPGKKIRLNFIKVLAHWTPVSEEKIQQIEEFAHYLHNTSLLLDDIQDYSKLRRGIPTAHTVYGIPKTLIGIDFLQIRIFSMMTELGDRELSKQMMKNIRQVIAGQGLEIYWRDSSICPTEEEYLQMIYRKTSLIFIIAQQTMNTFTTTQKTDANKMLITLGIYFQINDDYQNLHNQFYFDSKGFCEDITEGKFSFPIVHAINNFPKEGKLIKNILRERTTDVELKKKCLCILEKCGSFEYTLNTLEKLKSRVYAEMDKLDENPLMKKFIDEAMLFSL